LWFALLARVLTDAIARARHRNQPRDARLDRTMIHDAACAAARAHSHRKPNRIKMLCAELEAEIFDADVQLK